MPQAGAGLAGDGRDAHVAHEGGHVAPTDPLAVAPEEVVQHPRAGKRILQMEFVNPPHQGQDCRRDRGRLVVGCRASHPEELALPDNGPWVGSVDHRVALSQPALMSAPSQQACSRVSCPIFACRVLKSGASDGA